MDLLEGPYLHYLPALAGRLGLLRLLGQVSMLAPTDRDQVESILSGPLSS